MNEVFIIVSGEINEASRIEAVFEYEWLANVYTVDMVTNLNTDVSDRDLILIRNPFVKKASTPQTIEYWQSEVDFIRIDKWEVQ
jgi:hypothetical protein